MPRLIAFGCSNTYGQGLPDCHLLDKRNNLYSAGPNPSKYAWPSVLGKLLNRSVINLADPGGSNRNIWYKAVNFEYQPEDIVVLHWTFLYRTVALWQDKPPLHLGLWKNAEPTIGDLYKKFVTAIDSDYDRLMESLVYIDHINRFLKDKVNGVINIVFNPAEFDHLPAWTNINFDICAAPYNIDYPLALDNNHTGLQGHKALAKDLHKIILEKTRCNWL